MSSEEINLTGNGVKFSYMRFVSDSAPGFILLLYLLVLVMTDNTFFGLIVSKTEIQSISNEIRIFITLLAFLLATPLGMVVNSLSFYFLDWLSQDFVKFWVGKNYFFLRGINKTQNYDRLNDMFLITKDNFNDLGHNFYNALSIYSKSIISSFENIKGTRILLRNISFLTILISVNQIYFNSQIVVGYKILGTVFLTIFIIFMTVLCSLELYYQHVLTLNKARILCLKNKAKLSQKNDLILREIESKKE